MNFAVGLNAIMLCYIKRSFVYLLVHSFARCFLYCPSALRERQRDRQSIWSICNSEQINVMVKRHQMSPGSVLCCHCFQCNTSTATRSIPVFTELSSPNDVNSKQYRTNTRSYINRTDNMIYIYWAQSITRIDMDTHRRMSRSNRIPFADTPKYNEIQF